MAGCSKKSATKGEAAPVVIKATKSLKKGKREQKDNSKTKVNLKKPTKGVIAPFEKKKSKMKEIMKRLADYVQRLEAKVDLLATKADRQAILISAKGERVPAMKPPAKASFDSYYSYMDTFSDDEVTATKNPNAAAKNFSVKAKTENSSSDDESSSDEEPAEKPAAIIRPATKDSPEGICTGL